MEEARNLILAHWIARLEAVVLGADFEAQGELEAGMTWPAAHRSAHIVYSGGVGELVYRLLREDISETAPFGDLGVDLARCILASPVLSKDLLNFQPEGKGRAVAYGLLRHATEISGGTLHLPQPGLLPLRDLPIVAVLSDRSPDADFQAAFALARPSGGAVSLDLSDSHIATVKRLAARLLPLLGSPFSAEKPLVILVSRNVGKALGACLSDWGRGVHRQGLIVIDEVHRPDASFLHVGRMVHGVLPLSFYGMR